MGRRHRAFFRISAMDSRCPRDGRVLEELGIYDPANKDPEQQLKLNEERVRHWLQVGAQPTETVAQLLARKGISVR